MKKNKLGKKKIQDIKKISDKLMNILIGGVKWDVKRKKRHILKA